MCEAPSTIRRADPTEPAPSADWSQVEYTYDPSGRRIAKDVDGVVTKYLVACPELAERDGSHCIAEEACPEPVEWDANDVLLRKYIYGPGVDQPICMIKLVPGSIGDPDANAAPFGGPRPTLHDSNLSQSSIINNQFVCPFLFTGRRYDTETGLYYYRARYYNPTIGRFLQTDPIGYGDGMNWYAYCSNNPVGCIDPSGCARDPITEYFYAQEWGGWMGLTGEWNAMGMCYFIHTSPENVLTGTAADGRPVYFVNGIDGFNGPDGYWEVAEYWANSGHKEGGICELGSVLEFLEDMDFADVGDASEPGAPPASGSGLPGPDLGSSVGDAAGIILGVVGSTKVVPVVGDVATMVSASEALLDTTNIIIAGKVAEAGTRDNAKLVDDMYGGHVADQNDISFRPGVRRFGSKHNGKRQGSHGSMWRPSSRATHGTPIEDLWDAAGY